MSPKRYVIFIIALMLSIFFISGCSIRNSSSDISSAMSTEDPSATIDPQYDLDDHYATREIIDGYQDLTEEQIQYRLSFYDVGYEDGWDGGWDSGFESGFDYGWDSGYYWEDDKEYDEEDYEDEEDADDDLHNTNSPIIFFVIFFVVNITIAIIARIKLGRPYPPKKSRTCALIWSVIAFLVFICIVSIMNIAPQNNKNESIAISFLILIIGISIYFIFRTGYENNAKARYADLDKILENFREQVRMVNDDISMIGQCFRWTKNDDNEKIFWSFHKIHSLIGNKNINGPHEDGAVLRATKELLYCYAEYAKKMIHVRSVASKDYKYLQKHGNISGSLFAFKSEFFKQVDSIDFIQSQYLENSLESLLGSDDYYFMQMYRNLVDDNKIKTIDYICDLKDSEQTVETEEIDKPSSTDNNSFSSAFLAAKEATEACFDAPQKDNKDTENYERIENKMKYYNPSFSELDNDHIYNHDKEAIPTLDFHDLIYQDEDTIKQAQEKYARDMAEYVSNQLQQKQRFKNKIKKPKKPKKHFNFSKLKDKLPVIVISASIILVAFAIIMGVRSCNPQSTYVKYSCDISEAKYIGNTNSGKFHRKSCKHLPDKSNRIGYKTYDDAISAKMEPCKICKPK